MTFYLFHVCVKLQVLIYLTTEIKVSDWLMSKCFNHLPKTQNNKYDRSLDLQKVRKHRPVNVYFLVNPYSAKEHFHLTSILHFERLE